MQEYVVAGADMIFAEAVTNLEDYATIKASIKVPLLANMTEFGMTKLATTTQLSALGVDLVLYPLSAFRAMNAAALKVYQAIKRDGTQQQVLSLMQDREELYQHLNYHVYEDQLDAVLKSGKE